jgi:hypothetical protein
MARLRGTGLGAGMAMGAAVVVRTRAGAAVLPEVPARVAALIATHRLTETPDVIVVAEEYRTALAMAGSLPWATVAGLAAERADPDAATPRVPAVVGVEGLMSAAADDVLILVDATRGVVLLDPDPVYLAQYTAEHDRVAPRNRLYLDEAHLPAGTLDGRAITVVAITDSDVQSALTAGADALYHALPLTFDPAELRRNLSEVTRIAAGKPLIIPYNGALPLAPVVEAAGQVDITLALAPAEGACFADARSVTRLMDEISLAQEECDEHDWLYGSARIAVVVEFRPSADWPGDEEAAARLEALAAAGATRLLAGGPMDREALSRLAGFTAAATVHLMPVLFAADESTLPAVELAAENSGVARSLRLLIGAGVTGFVAAPKLVQPAKMAIRETSVSDARDELVRWLAG